MVLEILLESRFLRIVRYRLLARSRFLTADWKGQWKGESDLQVITLLVAILISFVQTGTRKPFLGIRFENRQNLV